MQEKKWDYTSRDTDCQFGPKGVEKTWNKGRLSRSAEILQNRPTEISSCWHPFSFEKREEQTWRWFRSLGLPLLWTLSLLTGKERLCSLVSERRATHLVSVGWLPLPCAVGSGERGNTTKSPVMRGFAQSNRVGLPSRILGWCCHFSAPSEYSTKSRKMILKPEDQMAFALLSFRFPWGPSFFLLSDSSFLEWKCWSCASPTIVFWNHITCLVSQVCSCRQFCLKMNHTFSFTHTWFWWYLFF